MPKIVDKGKMRESILQAGLSAFLKYGFHKTTMTKIAQEAKIAKGTLYLYFNSKEELTQTITDGYFEQLKERLTAKESFKTVDEFLKHIEISLLINDEDTQFIPIFFEAFGSSFRSESFIKKYDTFFNEIGDFYAENFQEFITNGLISKEIDSKSLGRVLISMIDGIVLHKGFFQMESVSYEKMVKESISFFGRGLR